MEFEPGKMCFDSPIMCFDDPETKTVHVISDNGGDAVCGVVPNKDIIKWPADSIDELTKMTDGEFNYSLCNKCQYNHISKFR